MEETGKFNINLYSSNKDQIENSSNGSQEYIILMNEELSNVNRNLALELRTTQDQLEIIEEDLGKQETKTVYMRGILKNIFGLNTMEKNLNHQHKKIIVLQGNHIDKLQDLFRHWLICIYLLYFLMFMANLITFPVAFNLLLFTFLIVQGTTFCTFKQFNIGAVLHTNFTEKLKYVKELRTSITNIEKNNDHINEYIDCI